MLPQKARAREQERKRLEKGLKDSAHDLSASAGGGAVDIEELAAATEEIGGCAGIAGDGGRGRCQGAATADGSLAGPSFPRRRSCSGAVVDGRVHLIVSVPPTLVHRGVSAGAVVKVAAEVVGGGGGGRDTFAQAGGRDPEKLPQALATARAAIETALES